jgi:hypothetical protein
MYMDDLDFSDSSATLTLYSYPHTNWPIDDLDYESAGTGTLLATLPLNGVQAGWVILPLSDPSVVNAATPTGFRLELTVTEAPTGLNQPSLEAGADEDHPARLFYEEPPEQIPPAPIQNEANPLPGQMYIVCLPKVGPDDGHTALVRVLTRGYADGDPFATVLASLVTELPQPEPPPGGFVLVPQMQLQHRDRASVTRQTGYDLAKAAGTVLTPSE